jgi:hypothetical protein
MIKRKFHGEYRVSGVAQFAGQAATVEVDCKGLTEIDACSFTGIGAFDANDQYTVAETVTADGKIVVPASGTITLTRNAGGVADRKVICELVGR